MIQVIIGSLDLSPYVRTIRFTDEANSPFSFNTEALVSFNPFRMPNGFLNMLYELGRSNMNVPVYLCKGLKNEFFAKTRLIVKDNGITIRDVEAQRIRMLESIYDSLMQHRDLYPRHEFIVPRD